MIKHIIILLIILSIGIAIGRFALPSKIIEKEHIVYQDRIVEKKVEVKDVKKKDNKIYIRIEKISSDGTKTIETKIIDKDATDTSDVTKDNKTENNTIVTDKEKTTIYNKQDTLISLGIKDIPSTNYGLLVNKRILGPFYLGGFLFTDKSWGLSVGISF